MTRSVVIVGLALLLAPGVAPAQTLASSSASRGHDLPVPAIAATRRGSAIVIDGRINEPAWAQTPVITELLQIDPDEGKPASERTEVRILYDDEALYVSGRMFDSHGAGGVTTRLARRDANNDSDGFQIVIDSYHDHLGRAFFQVNPSGVKFDALGVGASNPDDAWDPIWDVATSIDSLGWTAEMRIPFSQLRFAPADVQTWGLQIRRFIQRRQEMDQWAFWNKTETGGPPRFGHLTGLELKRAPQHLELLPYVVTRSRHVRPEKPGDPLNPPSMQDMRIGGDVKYLLTSNLTLDATFNPDFGQVEVDPAVVNLSAFETSFPEKRPFFVEGAGIFDFGSFSCFFCSNVSSIESFYSRRIGRVPTGASLATDAAKYARVPENSTILGAAKVTGRTRNGFTVGLMNAVTKQMHADAMAADGRTFDIVVEPLTNYFVGRLKRDYRSGNLVLGLMGTSVMRRLDSTFATRLNRRAEMVGTDVLYTWKNHAYSLAGSAAVSSIEGDSLAIVQSQLSSAHYFQRPDRKRAGRFAAHLDSSATSMRGGAGYLRLAKDAGNLLWEATVNGRTAGWEVNDISLLRRSNYLWHGANVLQQWTKPTRWYRQLFFIAGGQQQFNLDGDLTDRQLHQFVRYTSLGFWSWAGFHINRLSTFDDGLLRGGPVVRAPNSHFWAMNVSTDSRRALQVDAGPSYYHDALGGHSASFFASANWKALPNLLLRFGPNVEAGTSTRQYVETIDDATATRFYGHRYVLSSIDQRTLSLDTRVAATFTPVMTFEVYVQPFIASGRYFDFREFDAPRTSATSIYGRDRGTITAVRDRFGLVSDYMIDPDAAGPASSFTIKNPDFNVRSLRGNAVFRWEYRPGSTLYVVWTQSRSNSSPLGDFDFGRDRRALFRAHPDNIFLLKVNYWIGS